MLVLSRKQTESLLIDGDIRVSIVRISGNKVRLGIEAPPHVRITRSELEPQTAVSIAPDKKPSELDVACPIL